MSRDAFTDFSSWLQSSRGLAYGSATTYGCNVRRLVTAAGGNDRDAQAIMAAFADLPEYLTPAVRCAWTAYVDYCTAMRPRTMVPAPLPRVPRRRTRVPASPYGVQVVGAQPHHLQTPVARAGGAPTPTPAAVGGVPSDVREMIARLAPVLPELIDLLPRCQWAHVTDASYEIDGEMGNLIMIAPRVPGLILPKSFLSMLKAWGNPAGTTAPLLPREPGSTEALSSWGIRALLGA